MDEPSSSPIGAGLPLAAHYQIDIRKITQFLLDDIPGQAALKRELLNATINQKNVKVAGGVDVTVEAPITDPKYMMDKLKDAFHMIHANMKKYEEGAKLGITDTLDPNKHLSLGQRISLENQTGGGDIQKKLEEAREAFKKIMEDLAKQANLTEQQRAKARLEYGHNLVTGHHQAGFELDDPTKIVEFKEEYKQSLPNGKVATIDLEKDKDGKICKICQAFTKNQDSYNSDESIKANANAAVAAWGIGAQVKILGLNAGDRESLERFHLGAYGMRKDGTDAGLSWFDKNDAKRYYETQVKYLLQAAEAGLKVNEAQVKLFRPEDQKAYAEIRKIKEPEHKRAVEARDEMKVAPAKEIEKKEKKEIEKEEPNRIGPAASSTTPRV